ncbi:MAG: type IV pili twitching motility protein PilT [Lentisphaerae bacterium RIFOXYC12_FULL_60_16]|nr:MAG: type IV pili twitching motility protein PilT [Lentisphaerae bacterium RIFOXYC12_FULL_60_16]OGV72298.1 MAG: type IV pili twitching motility protein PilT [Lentisphaerae bacterium RIFOXYA12_FULL_60_10]OGV75222.1 MAG: type IV pili twitching motility protein PilT [Lentisphaerae bacterium RIFOXYB12_FULL_60_10]
MSTPEMSELLDLVVEEKASDLHITVGLPPVLRIHGGMQPLDADPLTPEDTERLMKSITSPDHQQKVREHGGTDFGFGFGDKARFRVSVLRSKGNVGIVLRQIPNDLLSLEQIGLPAQIKELLFKPRGLVLVTGPTGSGKSTTLASMVNVINIERDAHIITIEDPIEYYHSHKQSIVTQREVGVDVPSFEEALRRALRQDPDVILVGEMRDLETMRAAITAAETGHLVFATLHTTGAAATVDRIVDAFPTDQQEQVRTQLSVGLVAVVSQLLLVRADKPGRVAAFEIMIATSSIRSLIRDNKTFRITSDIQTGAKHGMITLDAHLMALYEAGQIRYEDLITKSQDPEAVVQKLQAAGGARR